MKQPRLNIFGRVRDLTGWRAVALSAALLERMLPNYVLFCEVTGYDDNKACRTCLDLIWESLVAPKSKINFGLQLEKIESATPDTADFDTYGVYPAIDAAMALVATVSLILKQDLQGAVVVSKLSQGSVEAYLLATQESSEEAIKAHPLMQFEIETQLELLDYVEQHDDPVQTAQALRAMALSEGISNIGLEIS